MKSRDVTIGQGSKIIGSLELRGEVLVNCRLEGELHVDGTLTVGEAGEIQARIFADKAVIQGTVVGDIICHTSLELQGGAHVKGNLRCPSLAIQDGVVFEGYCAMDEVDTSKVSTSADVSADESETNKIVRMRQAEDTEKVGNQ